MTKFWYNAVAFVLFDNIWREMRCCLHVQFVEFLWHPRQRRSCFCASSPRRTSNTDWTGFCSDHFLKEASPSSLSLLDTTLCKHVIVNYMTVSILPKKQLKYMDGEDGREPFPGCRKAHLLSGPLALRALHSRFLEIIENRLGNYFPSVHLICIRGCMAVSQFRRHL